MAGTLTIGVVTGVSPDEWVRVWRERMPDTDLRIVPVDDARPAAALADGVDMLFARIPLGDDDLHVIPLWEETIQATHGDATVFYTDGVTEARGPRGEQFGEARLTKLLEASTAATATELALEIEAAVLDFGGQEPSDDIAILVVRVL